jgi:Tol biopolymer transport system component
MKAERPLRDGVPSADETRQALERVLASKVFRTAESLSRILRFVVECAIEGKSDRVKEYTIGAEVLERGGAFDPQTDPIVRVQAGRLRSKLLQYYETEGDHDPVRIELPRGGYVPDISGVAVAEGTQPSLPRHGVKRSELASRWLIGVLVGLLAVTAWLLTRTRHPIENTNGVVRASIDPPLGTLPLFFALSPDGRSLAVAASEGPRTHLWLRSMNSSDFRKVPGSDGATNCPPFWSPDSRSLGFFANGALKRLDVVSGQVQRLCAAPVGTGGAWSSDGVILFSPGVQDPLYRIPADGGSPMPVTALNFQMGEESHRFPSFLPGGRHFVFYVRAARPDMSGVYLGSLDGTAPKRVLATESAAVVASGNRLLFSRNGNLFDAELDAGSGRIVKEPRVITAGLSTNPRLRWGRFSTSEHGTLVFDSSPVAGPEREMFWVDRQGRPVRLAGRVVNSRHISLSARALRAAYDYPDPATGTAAIAVLDLRRGTNMLVVSPPGRGDDPVLSSDGRQIAYRSTTVGTYELLRRDLDAANAQPVQLFRSAQPLYPTGWSPDGRHLLFDRLTDGKSDSWLLPIGAAPDALLFLAGASLAQFSPDGQFVVYVADGNGRKEIFLTSFPPAGTRLQISAAGGSKPRWRPDGRGIFYLAPDLRLMEAFIERDGSAVRSKAPTPLFETAFDFHDERIPYAVNLEGTAFLVAPYPGQNRVALEVISNWPAMGSAGK